MNARLSAHRRPLWLGLAGLILLLCGDLYNSFGFLVCALGGVLLLIAWLLLVQELCRSENARTRRLFRILRRVSWGVLILGLAVFLVTEGLIIAHSGGTEAPDGETLIVLGAGLHGDRPSATLYSRLVPALEYLEAHPDASAIVTGGQGENELRTEASVMAEWLTDRGIAPERIFLEEQATNTAENLAFSIQILEENNLSQPVVLLSSGFHLFRAELLAEREGLTDVQTIGAPVPVSWLIPSVYLREFCSVMLMELREIF